MKVFKIAIICLSMIAAFSTMAFSGTSTQTAAGSVIDLATTHATAPAFAFTPSPTTFMQIESTDNAYALTAVSSKTNKANGKQYGVVSSQSPIYELAANVDADGVVTLTVPTSASTLGSDWKDLAGNTAP